MKKFFLAALLLICYTFAGAQIFYVDGTSGSNSNSGTSLTTAWKTIQKAANSVPPGSTIYIRGGVYHENVNVNFSGLSSNPTVYTNYNGETVILDGTDTDSDSGTAMLRIGGASHLEFRNLTIRNLTCEHATGVRILPNPSGPTTNIKLINLTIHDINWTNDDDEWPSNGDNSHPIIVYGSGSTQQRAISNILIENCTVYHNITGYSESVTISGNVDGFMIRNNVVRDNTNVGIDVGGLRGVCPTPSLDRPRNGIIKGNRTYNNLSNYSTAAGIYIDGALQISIENNECYNNSYGIEVGCEENGITEKITVKNNVVYNNIECGIYVGGFDTQTTGEVKDCTIRNNTVYHNDLDYEGNGEIQFSKASNCIIENNIFYSHNQQVLMSFVDIEPQENNSFDYNCWFTPNNESYDLGIFYPNGVMYTDFHQYQNATGQDQNSFYGDPMVISPELASLNLNLQPESPCINNGNITTIISLGETAFSGIDRIFGILDIGAYEYPMTLDVKHEESEKPLLYPVPAKDFVNINATEEVRNAEIFSLDGTKIRAIYRDGRVDVSNLPTGFYMIRLQFSNGNSATQKFTKL